MEPSLALNLLIAAGCISAASGLPGLILGWRSPLGQRIATGAISIAALLGVVGAGMVFFQGSAPSVALAWSIPGGEIALQADALSAFFLAPVFLIGALGAIYGHGYWRQSEHPRHGQTLCFYYGTLLAGMILLLLARDAVSFLIGWEAMALSAFFLVRIEDHLPSARQAGWLYLLATHIGALCLFAMFGLMRGASGSLALVTLPASTPLPTCTCVFFLALLGFGLKAGIMPLHVWLPDAHASAPSHVSALMSGVVIKMGIYGIVRMCALLPEPPVSWGMLLLLLGAVSGVLGVAFAIGQHDVKRLLAYHSIENIGIMAIGLGLAMVGRSLGRTDWIVLGLSGCLLHVWNHGMFKALLFLGAGSVIHAVHTREIDRMGGLAKRMPYTAVLFLVGAVAICGLPPLNGFVSEFLIYLGLFRTLGSDGSTWSAAALAAPVLALIGALAVACFVKVHGTVFLGTARSARAENARESPRSMLVPMMVLAGCCVVIGLAPLLVAPILDRSVGAWAPLDGRADPRLASLVPLGWVSASSVALVALGSAGFVWMRFHLRRVAVQRKATWACGYPLASPRVQYTSSSFAEMLVGLFAWVLRPRTVRPRVAGPFPRVTHFQSRVEDTFLAGMIVPASRTSLRWLSRLRFLQQGSVQQYLLYVLVAVIGLLLWSAPISDVIVHVFSR